MFRISMYFLCGGKLLKKDPQNIFGVTSVIPFTFSFIYLLTNKFDNKSDEQWLELVNNSDIRVNLLIMMIHGYIVV